MVYRKGERTNGHREQAFKFAVDVPIPREGLGDAGLSAIAGAMGRCQKHSESWAHSEFRAFGERKSFFVRIGTETEIDADSLVLALSDFAAQRAR